MSEKIIPLIPELAQIRTPRSLKSLMKKAIPEMKWIIPNLIPEGLTCLAGKPKMGKSWLVLHMALAVSQGGYVLGKIPVECGDVLYLALEDSERRLRDRAERMLEGQAPPDNFEYYTGETVEWDTLANGGLANLEAWLETHPQARLIIIDTLTKVREPSRFSSNLLLEDYKAAAPLAPLAYKYKVGIIFVYHARKMGASDPFDEISGSTGLTAACDTTLVLRRENMQQMGTLHIRGRDVEEQELVVEFDRTLYTWKIANGVSVRELGMSPKRKKIVDLLRLRGEMTPKAIASELDEPVDRLYKMLHDMTQAGEIVRTERGLYKLAGNMREGRGEANSYSSPLGENKINNKTCKEGEVGKEGSVSKDGKEGKDSRSKDASKDLNDPEPAPQANLRDNLSFLPDLTEKCDLHGWKNCPHPTCSKPSSSQVNGLNGQGGRGVVSPLFALNEDEY